MSDRVAWRIASANAWSSAFGKPRRGKRRRPGPPVHDDLCAMLDEHGRTRHVFTAETPNQLWLTAIAEHKTAEGKLYLCAIRDVLRPNRRVLDRLENEVPFGRPGREERCSDAR